MNHWIENVFRRQLKRLHDHIRCIPRVDITFLYNDGEFRYDVSIHTEFQTSPVHAYLSEFHEEDIKGMVDKLICIYEMRHSCECRPFTNVGDPVEIRMEDYEPLQVEHSEEVCCG